MVRWIKKIMLIGFFVFPFISRSQDTNPRQTILFDKDWSFIQSDMQGADKVGFDDTKWTVLDLPHDWSIFGQPDKDNPTGSGGGYMPAGIGWYRKHFNLSKADAHKRIFIYFDGVMANSDVWINGFHLGERPYGYISFAYELTGHLKFGKGETNILSVRVDNSVQPASRYYTGAGIYRHVHLIIKSPVYIDKWGVFITTPQVSSEKATVNITTTVFNSTNKRKNIVVQTSLVSPKGKEGEVFNSQTKSIEAGKSVSIEQNIPVINPSLWDTHHPNLYKAITKVKADKVVDEQITTFGIRSIQFTADSGFVLNGKKVMIKGVCMHHDGGAVGAAVPLGVWERRLQLLKNIGVNGIRTSHNPVAPEFLDLCDRMGFLVMDETFDTWEANKVHGKGGYQEFFKQWGLIDARDQVMHDRNHPSIVIYSVGNEIHDNLNDSAGFKKYRDLQNTCHRYDGTRPVTMAILRPATSKVYVNGFAEMMDVVGQNYRENELVAAHETHPNWKVTGTENGMTRDAWLALRDHPYIAGQFLWVGFDYLGEAIWPNVINNLGLFDHANGIKPIGLQRESWWSTKPVVHIVRRQEKNGKATWVADWTPKDTTIYKEAIVQIYTNCDEVELFLNGKSLGTKPKNADDAPIQWSVTYKKGTLNAVGRNKGFQVAIEQLKTAEAPAKIILTADKSSIKNNWNDLSYITAKVVDANGVMCPQAAQLITFSTKGSGKIFATDNGSTSNHEKYSSHVRAAYQGKAIAIVKANAPSGSITIKADSPGLQEGKITIEVQ